MANRNINQPTPAAGSVNSRRIFPGWGNITFQEPRGNSNYHAMQLKAEKRFSKGNVFLISYTFGTAIDEADSTQLSTSSGTGNLQDQKNFRSERSPSFQNVKHRFVLSYVCELPVGRDRALLTDVSPAFSHTCRASVSFPMRSVEPPPGLLLPCSPPPRSPGKARRPQSFQRPLRCP